MRAVKWIDELRAETPVAEAARHALTVRLEVVQAYLPLAIHEAEKDVEHVHQLRVATRRARAALDIFALCLPEKIFKAARKGLRRIRRAAGAARDWDVFRGHLQAWATRKPTRHRPGLDFLHGHALARRLAAQELLAELGRDLPFDFDRLLAQTVAAVNPPINDARRTLLDLARPLLTELLGKLTVGSAGDLDDHEHLHQVRIIGKKLRYAMEIFAHCFPPAFRDEIYPAVEAMQEILGEANDSHVAAGRLEEIGRCLRDYAPAERKRFGPGIEAWQRAHVARLPELRRQFRAWWQDWHTSGEIALQALLS